MDNNEYRTKIIVNAYEFAERVQSIKLTCEDWFLLLQDGELELRQDSNVILSVTKQHTRLISDISISNHLPYYVEQWFMNK